MNKEELLNIKEFKNLSDSEREIALQILKQYNDTGSSQIYSELLYDDYKEIPVDIETFITDDLYLGKAWKDAQGKSKLYPFWLDVLKKIFPTNIDTDFNTLLESGARGIGKAQPLDSLVFTEDGYVKMRDIKIGTKVYGADGKLHNVIGVFPQGLQPTYEIELTDNSKTLCAEDHLWTVRDNKDMKIKTLATKEIIANGLLRSNRKTKYNEYRYKLPLVKSLKYNHIDTLISPYLMGCLLGDGCFSNMIGLTTYDDYIKNYLEEEISKNNYELAVDRKSYYIHQKIKTMHNMYKDEIVRLGLYKHTAKDKFIPKEYLYNDSESRLSLLQGLLDTDGTINKSGSNVYLSTISKQLAEDTLFLAQSLGASGYIKEKTNNKYRYNGEVRPCNDNYIVTIKLPNHLEPFRLERKLNRINPNRLEPQRNIRSIKYVGQKDCQCILIDSEEHLYLTNDLIVTHNTEVAVGCVGAYLMYRVMCLKNPLEFYHLKLTEKICFAFMNIKKDLSEEIATSKFQNTIQMSPWFMARGTLTRRNNASYWVPPEPINIIIGSQSDDVIGQPIFYAFFDEISFIRNQDIDKQKKKAKDMIDTAIGGMMTRFIHKGKNPTMLVVASSKRSEQSFMEDYIKRLSKTENTSTYVVDKPVWKVKPKGTYSSSTFFIGLGNKFLESIVIPEIDYINLDRYKEKGYQIIEAPIDFKTKADEDLERMLCDYAGISSSSSNKYLSAARIMDVINKDFHNPFPDIIECGNDPEDTAQYQNYFNLEYIPKALMLKPLFVHLDMSISGDMTGIAGVWISGKKISTNENTQSKDVMFRLAFSTSIKAPKGRQISFEKNRNFIRWLRDVGFNVRLVTSDTFQSYDLQQQLKAEKFECEMLSVDRIDSDHICKPYQYMKSTIYEKRIQMFKSNRLFDEMVQLERNIATGKVDHPANGHKDALDAVTGATFTASKHAEEYAYDFGETMETLINVNTNQNERDKQQIILDFEKELNRALDPLAKLNEADKKVHVGVANGPSTIPKPKQVQSVYIASGIIL